MYVCICIHCHICLYEDMLLLKHDIIYIFHIFVLHLKILEAASSGENACLEKPTTCIREDVQPSLQNFVDYVLLGEARSRSRIDFVRFDFV